MRKYLKENVNPGELEVYKMLSSERLQAYNKKFSTLILPRAIGIDEEKQTLTLPYYEGETFNSAWNTSNGGASLDLNLASEVPSLLKDLSKIDTSLVTATTELSSITKLVFKHKEAELYFGGMAARLNKEKLITDKELAAAIDLLRHKQTTDLVLNNGDFYPRNFIRRSDGRIVLIDWETWNPHSPFYIIDHPENIAAVHYVHMWGNPRWQEVFHSRINEHFAFEEISFNKGIVIKALTSATFFRKHKNLVNGQLQILKKLLTSR